MVAITHNLLLEVQLVEEKKENEKEEGNHSKSKIKISHIRTYHNSYKYKQHKKTLKSLISQKKKK